MNRRVISEFKIKHGILNMSLLLAMTNLMGQQSLFLDNIYRYIEDPALFEINQEPGHVTLIPFDNAQKALDGEPEASGNYMSLNGVWKFYYAETPDGIPAAFYSDGFNDKGWSNIKVPGNWEMQGFGDPLFRNVTTPFHPDPPKVPREYNPTGSYRRIFRLPEQWKGKQVFLRLEKTASASFIWLNGREVGYNEGGQEPAEYNVTRFLKPGRNTLAVSVIKYSDGYYLEDQDYWRLAGIFDDVWLFAAPGVHMRDWQAITDLDQQYRDAELILSVDLANYGPAAVDAYSVKATLYNDRKILIQTLTSEKVSLSPGSGINVKFSGHVINPAKWSAEFPGLYTLVFELVNARGKTEEAISGRIGFKETEIRHQVFYLNGVPVKLNGINSHMQHPDMGHTMDEETIRKDLSLLKQFNINCVRTSHYPPVNRYLELADEYGIYIVDETGDESHATEYVSGMKEWEGMYMERVQKMVLRDRNHPCVLFWSAGNESGEGSNICSVIAEGKKLDPVRFWMYGGNAFAHPCEDIIGPRYPTPVEWITQVGLVPENQDPRPSFMDEYLSVAGNGGGGLDDYWEAIYAYPRSMGGAIWDFVSPGLREKIVTLKDASLHQVQVNTMGRAKLVAGKTGKAIDLNGHDQWVEVYRDQAVEIDGNALTLTMWVYPRKLNSSAGTLISKGSYQFGLRQTGKDSLEFYLTTGRRHVVRIALPADWEDNWHHVAAVYDGKKIVIALDGQTSKAIDVSGNIRNLPFPLNIGRNAEIHGQETSDYLCDAIIDQVGVFPMAVEPDLLCAPSADLKRQSALWLDFEEMTESGEFFSYGIGARTYGSIWPDRRPQPEMWQIKKSAQPVTAKLLNAEEGLVEVSNRYLFTSLSELQTIWILEANGKEISRGELSLEIQPLTTSVIRIPFEKPSPLVNGVEYFLQISFRQKKATPWSGAGFEIAWEQFKLPWDRGRTSFGVSSVPTASIRDSADHLIVEGLQFTYTFSKKTGHLESMHHLGKELIRKGPEMNIWRAPLANETDEWGGTSSGTTHWGEGYGRMAVTDWYSTGIHNMKAILERLSFSTSGEGITLEMKEILITPGQTGSFQNRYRYIISGTGEMIIEHTVIPGGEMPAWLPRMGTEWILSKDLERINWYGRGPQENYPDRKTGYRIGNYGSTVRDMVEPYLIPQDYGLRTDIRWVRMMDKDGAGLEFSGDRLFNFSAFPFTTENLTRALYTYQLQAFDEITFNFDYATSGVGCTARSVFNQYRVMPARYDFVIKVRPISTTIE